MDKSESCGPGPRMLLSPAQLDEFKTEGALMIPGVVTSRCAWRVAGPDTRGLLPRRRSRRPQHLVFRAVRTQGWLARIQPQPVRAAESCSPSWSRSVAEFFSPSHPAGQPWTPQVPMTRVILPSVPGTEWAPPADGHLDGYASSWGGGFMAFFAVLLWDLSSPTGGGTAYWPRSHLANHRYFLEHPEQFDGSYYFAEPVRSGGHLALLEGDPNVGEVVCMTGRAGGRNAAPRPHYAHRLG